MGAPAPRHPTDRILQAFGLGKLDDASSVSVSEHLEGCDSCRRRVAELSSDSFLSRLREVRNRPGSVVSSLAGLSTLDNDSSTKAPPPSSTLPPGLAQHADYEIVRELGQGGMGTVYLAKNRLMGRYEVLKVVSSHLINRSGVLDRFLIEIRNAARLHHTNIVTAYSAMRLVESIVFAMEFVDGLDLAKLVKSKGPLPVSNACNYVQQAALGLEHAHELGMVHRDIKPSNLMLARQGSRAIIKVLDFGLAKVKSEGPVDGGLTHEGQMLGTPDFIAPEQILDARGADIRADIYSLGCTLYCLLTGAPPFHASSLYEILQAHHSKDALPLNLARPEVPAELAAVVAKMMAKEPERRFRQPNDVAQALMPFFRKGTAKVSLTNTEVSQVGPAGRKPETRSRGSVPTLSATNVSPSPAPALKKQAETARTETPWDRLIAFKETEPPKAPPPAVIKTAPQKPSWLWPAVASGVMLLVLLAAWAAGILRVKTANGTIVLEDGPADAVVEVDGDRIQVTPTKGEPIKFEATAGKHGLVVRRGDLVLLVESVTLEAGKEFKHRLTARLEPPVTNRLAKIDLPATRQTVNGEATPIADRTGFSVIAGQWSQQGDELVQTDLTRWNNALMFGDDQWTDYDFSVDAMRTGGSNSFSLFFRSTDRGGEFEYVVAGEGNKTCHIQAYDRARTQTLKSHDFSLQNNTWYTAHVRVRGSHFECSIYDSSNVTQTKVFDILDARHPAGRVGLGTFLSAFRFKNIKVTAPDGSVLWDGPPALGSKTPTSGARSSISAPETFVSATAQPGRKKRLLAITDFAAFVHKVAAKQGGQPSLVERVLDQLAELADFEVVVSRDSRGWIKPEHLKDFDAVFFYTSGELSITPEGKAALLEFVRSGKGFAGCHSATDTLYQWPAYGELIGAYFNKHLGYRDVTIRVDDAAHPSTRQLDRSFRMKDEIYQFRAPFSREKLHTLMHFDYPGVSNGGAMAWTKQYGSGRVFYTALGHDEVVWSDERFRKHLLGGLRYVLGMEANLRGGSSTTTSSGLVYRDVTFLRTQ